MRIVLLGLVVAALALAACKPSEADRPGAKVEATLVRPPPPPPPPPLAGFSSDKAHNVFGYYMPEPELKVGDWKLVHIDLGSPEEFARWEKGERETTYGPVMIQFEDVTGGYATSEETGGQYAKVQSRVLPEAYAVAAGQVRFRGRDPKLGVVTFEGALDPKAAAAEQDGKGEAVAMTGTLTVGAQTFENVKFTWFGGD